MSSLSVKHRAIAEDVFAMESGYVLSFSNDSFQSFVLSSINIDIYEGLGYTEYCSKANKLRKIFADEPDAVVGKLLVDLLDYREVSILREKNVGGEYVDPYMKYVQELRNVAKLMCSEVQGYPTNEDRLNDHIFQAQIVLNDLVEVSERLCNNYSYNQNSLENNINDFFRDMLIAKGYTETKDQTRHGISTTGKDSGEVDILIEKNAKEIAIIEGFNLSSVNTSYIDTHINKAIVNYNTLGTATFIMAYVSVIDFESFWNKYYKYIKGYNYPLNIKQVLQEQTYPNASVRIAEMILSRDGYDFPVYFLAVNISM